jgi:hypothetical protein
MAQTALQELKEAYMFIEGEEYIQIVLKKEEWADLLKKEARIIMDSYEQGVEDENERVLAESIPSHNPSFRSALDYYNEEYNQDK